MFKKKKNKEGSNNNIQEMISIYNIIGDTKKENGLYLSPRYSLLLSSSKDGLRKGTPSTVGMIPPPPLCINRLSARSRARMLVNCCLSLYVLPEGLTPPRVDSANCVLYRKEEFVETVNIC